ncbi:MAG: bifunctional diaminohydroxyphosphoribosylaminopyrimidine deaminase/5-amino-6-(5-phosphoribosylamino)uracil reductase RibD [Lentimicrobiaceae bacterium]|nr:bifunctional diaminohydroxyphosphoribosylaminopyrimidine deaminase/5-amino-6-(5-phosphoribosylamino)uracil reductase RibD [Lentimicrobiaceae bacterium]
MNVEELWMSRAIQLAALGLGKVHPNPLVGAVIVYNDHIIGEGFHQQYGTPHAEINAIHKVLDKELLKKSTLYVNLEPCSHIGKNPPCAFSIIDNNIPKVVVGMRDPNPKVNGRGIELLKNNGIEVVEDVLNAECLILNKRFITFHAKKRPYIFLKWAQTKNGLIDIIHRLNVKNSTTTNWITNDSVRVWTHKQRNEEQAILIGYNTYINDNPQLSNRFYGSNQPKRFLLCDTQIQPKIEQSFSILSRNIEEIVDNLYQKNIQSLIVEGGQKTLQKFIDANLWDEAFVLTGNVIWEQGIKAPIIPYNFDTIINFESDTIWNYRNRLRN